MATESDQPNAGALGTLVAVGTFSMLGISLVVTALVRAEMTDEAEKKEVAADRPYRDLVAEQTAQLNAPAAYKDRGRGLVTLPIDRAMDLVVSGLTKDPNSATPPPPVGGSGGMGAAASTEAGGMGGSSGLGGTGGSTVSAEGEPETAPTEEPKPSEDLKKEGDKPQQGGKPEKKEAPKPVPAAPAPKPVPAAPAPAPAPAAPAPAPAPVSEPPHGQ